MACEPGRGRSATVGVPRRAAPALDQLQRSYRRDAGGEAVADAPHVLDVAVAAGGGQLAAQAAGVAVQRAGAGRAAKPPHVAQQLLLGVNLLGVAREVHEQLVLAATQHHRRAGDPDGASGGVDLKLSVANHLRRVAPVGAAQQRTQAGEQLGVGERRAQSVVGAGVQGPHDAAAVGTSDEAQHAQAAIDAVPERAATQRTQQHEALAARRELVEQHQRDVARRQARGE